MGRWLLIALLPACALDESGLANGSDAAPPIDGSVVETGQDASPDVTPDVAPLPCTTPAGACVASLESGWSLLAYDAQGTGACPGNFTQVAPVVSATAQAGACDCKCTLTSSPACDVGSVQRYISTDNTCSNTGTLYNVNGPGCYAAQGAPLAAYAKGAAIPPSGGTCAGSAVMNNQLVTTTLAHACVPPAACEEDVCNGTVPSGFAACVVHDGTQATCPAGWGASPVVVGDGFDLQCSQCTCDLNGTTCTNATLNFYSDTKCQTLLVSQTCDGTCTQDTASGSTPASYDYKATLNVACNATGPKAAKTPLTNPRTICCK